MIVITRNNEYAEKDWTQEEFEATSLPHKGWAIYTGVWPIPEPEPTPRELILAQIAALESQITVRRTREAILGTDGGWLANIDTQIAVLRAELSTLVV